jgi:outer membrane protein assembly factor BamB
LRYTTPLFAGNKLFCGSGDRHLYVINIDRMELIRRIDLHARVYASPKLVDGRVIVATTGGRLLEIDVDTLDMKGALQLPDVVTNAVTLSDDGRYMYVSTYMNHLYAFERLKPSKVESPTISQDDAPRFDANLTDRTRGRNL